LLAGTLDAIDGMVAFGLKGMNPIQVLQYIASGLLGVDSFKGGLATAGLGALLHYFIAFVVALVYYHSVVSCLHCTNRPSPGDWPTVRRYTFP